MKRSESKLLRQEFNRLIASKEHDVLVSIIGNFFETDDLRDLLINKTHILQKEEILDNFIKLDYLIKTKKSAFRKRR
jgi:hypothetical protein